MRFRFAKFKVVICDIFIMGNALNNNKINFFYRVRVLHEVFIFFFILIHIHGIQKRTDRHQRYHGMDCFCHDFIPYGFVFLVMS